MLGQVTGLLRWKSNQANPLRSLAILSAAALYRRPSVTHTAPTAHAHNELFERKRRRTQALQLFPDTELLSGSFQQCEHGGTTDLTF